jgi:hypothetical protein
LLQQLADCCVNNLLEKLTLDSDSCLICSSTSTMCARTLFAQLSSLFRSLAFALLRVSFPLRDLIFARQLGYVVGQRHFIDARAHAVVCSHLIDEVALSLSF